MSENLKQIVQDISQSMIQFHDRLESCAQEMELLGGDPDTIKKLTLGAGAMNDSANLYLSWARHYVALSEGGASEADEGEEDSDDFQF